MTTKKQITEKVKELKKLGLELITFQTDKRKRKSESGMPDYFLCGRGYVIFLECKIGKDKIRKTQSRIFEALELANKKNQRVLFGILTDTNYEETINQLIKWIAKQG